MHYDIDKYAYLESPIHLWDTRFKIISLVTAIICISMLHSIPLILSSLGLTVILTIISKMPGRFMIQKVKYPFLFLLPLFLFLPLTSGGQILYDLKYFNIYYNGIFLSSVILLKAISIMTLFILLLGTSSFNHSTKALLALRVPAKLVNLMLFSYRYIFVYLETLRKMKIALTLRGYKSKNSIKSLKNTAALVGSILVRSFEQTERVYNAMVLRGFEETIPVMQDFSFKWKDLIQSITVVSCFAMITLYNYIK